MAVIALRGYAFIPETKHASVERVVAARDAPG
jgi:hypothetical protein